MFTNKQNKRSTKITGERDMLQKVTVYLHSLVNSLYGGVWK